MSSRSHGRLPGRIALITGSSSGIGRATALAFAREGAKLVCADLTPGTWRESGLHDEASLPTHEHIQRSGGAAIFIRCDVTLPDDVANAVRRAVDEFGRLDIMVNNAGFALETRAPAPVWETSVDTFSRTLECNVKGVFYGIKFAAAQMITQEPLPSGDRGHILNAASIFGLVGTLGASAYCSSKGAVVNLTRAAALDCAAHRIHVNAVNPGYTATHMTDPLLSTASSAGGNSGNSASGRADPTLRAEIDARHPFRGVGDPEDIARAYVFLASEDAGWMTGVNLPVDGGFTAQ